MDCEKMSAMFPGFLFSALSFQNLNSETDMDGFLLGERSSDLNNSLTESPLSDVEDVCLINIQRYIPCNQLYSFYNSSGEINGQALKKLISCYEKNVIGWYKFRRNSDQIMSFREKILHQNLQEHLSNEGLVFLLLTSSTITENGSTHILDYALHRFHNGLFQKVPLVVINVGTSEHEGYKTVPGTCRSTAFGQAIFEHGSAFFNTDGTVKDAEKMTNLYMNIQDELKEMSTLACESEQLVRKLRKDIKILKEKIAKKKKPKDKLSAEASEETDGKKKSVLYQAFRTFLPSQEFMEAHLLGSPSDQIPVEVSDAERGLDPVSELTLMVESSDNADSDDSEDVIIQEIVELQSESSSRGTSFRYESDPLEYFDESNDEDIPLSLEFSDEDTTHGDDVVIHL